MSKNTKKSKGDKKTKSSKKNKEEKQYSNKAMEVAEMAFNPTKTKNRICNYYDNNNTEKPKFMGGIAVPTFLTAILEKLTAHILNGVVKNDKDPGDKKKKKNENDSDSDDDNIEITRHKIKMYVEKDYELSHVFFDAMRKFDPGNDSNSGSKDGIISDIDLRRLSKKHLNEHTTITPDGNVYITYLINYAFNSCIYHLFTIKKAAKMKSISMNECKAAVRLFLKENYYDEVREYATKAVSAVNSLKNEDSDNDKKQKKKKKTKKDESDNDSGESDKSDSDDD